MPEKNKAIIEQVNAAFAEGSAEKFFSLCAEDVEWTMIGDRTVKGTEAIRQWMASMGVEPPKITVENVIAEGDFAAAHGEVTIKGKDGKAIPYSYCDIYRFRDGRIVGLTAFVINTEAGHATSGGA